MPIAQFSLGHGGAEMQCHRLAKELIRRGHQVEIVTTRPAGEPAFAVVEGVPVRRLFAFGNRRLVWRAAPYTYTALLLAHLLRHKPDVVHAHQAFHPAWAAVVARRRFGGAPVVVKVATAGEFGDVRQMTEGRATLPIGSRHLLRQIVAHADALVAISSAVGDELTGGRIVRIPNGVDLPAATPTREEARRQLGVDGRLILYVGRAGAQKGADLLARAWQKAKIPARLVMLGEGVPDVPEVRAAGIEAPGRVRNVDLYLRAADLFVLPSRGEGLSNALLEAMAHGLPCLVSDLAANRELVDPGVTGLVFPAGDEDALAHALQQPIPPDLGKNARALVEKQYTLAAVVSRYEELYTQLVR
jgi:glycosyltransferase involved in cell wall biosynthesis